MERWKKYLKKKAREIHCNKLYGTTSRDRVKREKIESEKEKKCICVILLGDGNSMSFQNKSSTFIMFRNLLFRFFIFLVFLCVFF